MFGIIVFLVLCINVLGTMTGGNDRCKIDKTEIKSFL